MTTDVMKMPSMAPGADLDAYLRTISQFPIPKRLEALAMQCLSKDPSLRPQTAAELVRELNEDWR